MDKVNAGENQTIIVQILLDSGKRVRLVCELLSTEGEE